MAIREGRWDCPSCGSRAVFGRHVDCPGCGKPRPAGTRFYLTDDAPVITDAAQLAEATAGADWVCAHCGASNRATRAECGGCGAARGTSPSQPVVAYGPGQVPRAGGEAPPAGATGPAAPLPVAGTGDPQPPPWTCPSCGHGNPALKRYCGRCNEWDASRPLRLFARGQWGCTTMMALVPVAFAALIGKGCYDEGQRYKPLPPVPGTVVAVRWERSVAVEERVVEEGSGFQLPDSAQVLSRERALERYDSVPDGYRTEYAEVDTDEDVTTYETRTREVSERVQTGERTYTCQRDLGNGYFDSSTCTEPVYETRTRTEQYEVPVTRRERGTRTVRTRVPVYRAVPVYGTLYRWRAPRWNVVDVDTLRGGTAPPAWPAPPPAPGRRAGRREERYYVTVRRPRMPDVEVNVPLRQWDAYRVGRTVAVRGYRNSYSPPYVLPADSLPACRRWHAGKGSAPPARLGCSPRAAK